MIGKQTEIIIMGGPVRLGCPCKVNMGRRRGVCTLCGADVVVIGVGRGGG